ncbi:MAG: hypothetical protein Kow00109_05850 [Acidobacteriota bacterium]
MLSILRDGFKMKLWGSVGREAWSVGCGGITTDREWDSELMQFVDANFYQTAAYAKVHKRGTGIARWVLTEAGRSVAMMQAFTVEMRRVGLRFAYVFRGPVWKRDNGKIEKRAEEIAEWMATEIVKREGWYLRLVPYEFSSDEVKLSDVLRRCGFLWRPSSVGAETLIMNLEGTADEVLGDCRRKWRQTLTKALRNDLSVNIGTSEELIEGACRLNREMYRRKRIPEFVVAEEFLQAQRFLPEEAKLSTVLVQSSRKEYLAAVTWASVGRFALPLIAATSNLGVSVSASYVAWWKMVETLIEREKRWLDLGGINKKRNLGGYTFKTGLAGKRGKIEEFVGELDGACSPWASTCVKMLDVMNALRRAWRVKVRRSGRLL